MTSVLDLTDLGRLTALDGPYLSVYIPTAATGDWPTLREELSSAGAPDSALGLVDQLVRDAGPENDTLAVIADATKVLVQDYLGEAFIYSRGQWSDTADLIPIIKARQTRHADTIEDDEERRAQKTEVADQTVDMLERFKSGDRVAAGIHETVAAMNRAEVEVLLVRDDRDERRDVPHEDAAVVDALVRDAIATGASVHVIPASGPVNEGVGALLRQP